jgi:mRNA interferase MazF
VILTRDESIDVLYDLVVCPVTSIIRGLDTEVELGPDDGMPRTCVLNLTNAASAEKAMLIQAITALGPERMAEICRALRIATSC